MITPGKESPPSTSPAGFGRIVLDPADNRVKMRLDDGTLVVLSPYNDNDNALVNGSFPYAQRQAPGTLTTYSQTAARAYAADRWSMTNENASIQYQRVDTITAPETGLSARYYGKFKKITSAGKFCISQPVEGSNMAKFRGRSVRFQAKMRYSVAASMTVRMGLLQLTSAGTVDVVPGYTGGSPSGTFISAFGTAGTDPTFGTNLSAITPRTPDGGSISGNGLTCVLTNGWVRYSAVYPIPSNCVNLIPVIFTNGQPAATDELNVSEVRLRDGEEIMDWSDDLIVIEYAKILRTYVKSFNVDTAPAQNVGLPGAVRGSVSVAGATAGQPIGVRFPAPARNGAGTYTFFNPSAANALVRNTTAGTDATATTVANASEQGIDVNFTGIAAWTVAQSVAIHYTADNEI